MRKEYGFALLSIALLSRWSTGNTIFAAQEGFLKYGFSAVFSFSLAGVFALLALLPIVLKVKSVHEAVASLHELLQYRLDEKTYVAFQGLFRVSSYFGIISLGYAASILLYPLHVPLPVGMAVFMLGGFLVDLFFQTNPFANYRLLKISMLILVMVGILVHSYLLEGIEVVYNGIRLYHPYLLFASWKSFPVLFFVFWITMLGRLIIDANTWGIVLNARKTKLKLGIPLTSLIWGSIPFAFAMIALSSIYQGSFDGLFSIFEKTFMRYDNILFSIIIIAILLFILFDTMLTHIRIIVEPVEGRKLRLWLGLPILVAVVPSVIRYFSLTILDLFFIFGAFYASIGPIFLCILLRGLKKGMYTIWGVIGSTVIGWMTYLCGADYGSVLISFLLACLFVLARQVLGFRKSCK